MSGYEQIIDYPVRVRASAIVGIAWDANDNWCLLTEGGHRFALHDGHTVDALCNHLAKLPDDERHAFIDFDEIDDTAASYRMAAFEENKRKEQAELLANEQAARVLTPDEQQE